MKKRGVFTSALNGVLSRTMTPKSQIWVETVIYTLIGLTIMGIVISVITPKINQMTDKAVIEQSTESLNKINEAFSDILLSSGSQQQVNLLVKKGEYLIDAIGNRIVFNFKNSNYKYSELNLSFKKIDVYVLTIDQGNKKYDVSLWLNYSYLNLTYNDKKENKFLTTAANPYPVVISNIGGIDKRVIFKSVTNPSLISTALSQGINPSLITLTR